MKYSVVNERCSPPKVLLTFPFSWMAEVMAKVYGGEDRGIGVVETPTSPQVVINICTQRDELHEELSELQARFGEQHPAIAILWGLVGRGDDGQWVTVHDTETVLDDLAQKALNEMLG